MYRIIHITGGAVKEIVKHKFNLWDYQKEIENDGEIVKVKDQPIQLYLPYFRTDCLQMVIARDEDFINRKELDFLATNYILPGMNVLDIGANIGNHSVYFAAICKAAVVHSFEPQKDIFEILKKNIELNHISNICIPHNVALGSEDGQAKIAAYTKDNTGGTSVAMDSKGDMPVKKLDDFGFKKIGFIKIDVEGFEYNVLAGAEKLLKEQSSTLYIEIYPDKYDRVNELLSGYGYSVERKATEFDYIYSKNG